jgi:hypothetical protein
MNTEIQTEIVKMNSKDAATLSQEDIICIEGSTKELCENPELFPVVESLKDLKNKFIQDVQDLSNKYDLDGSVKVVFSIYTKKDGRN